MIFRTKTIRETKIASVKIKTKTKINPNTKILVFFLT